MKYIKLLIAPVLLIIGVFVAIACEPDDICPEGVATTPRLIIDFHDILNPDNKKNVFDLIAFGVGNDNVLSDYYFTDTDEVFLPLKTDVNTTQYTLISDATVNDNGTPDDDTDDYIEGNPDTITINYSREEVYVSRACGYKTIYKNVTLTIEPDADNWMLSRQPMNENQSVENEDETHFIISH
ncbi:hypothetical protein JJL45_09805 [Tamlana sp. s12]|uniref:DUF6452 family protein n=1 Tax=Tamlana sp. s12 TaxID=1630406 RepID=UPI0008023B6D|nr:DUF6452 family protein [Tamlana sp. s12]OBQ52757.1 hypothetical protein VQ01_12440 [Tamlana sp. s12]QQY81223.1 hypothetical protein JJL45_09805 [Tamlana sp. s12]